MKLGIVAQQNPVIYSWLTGRSRTSLKTRPLASDGLTLFGICSQKGVKQSEVELIGDSQLILLVVSQPGRVVVRQDRA
jgi:hypothetical protein